MHLCLCLFTKTQELCGREGEIGMFISICMWVHSMMVIMYYTVVVVVIEVYNKV